MSCLSCGGKIYEHNKWVCATCPNSFCERCYNSNTLKYYGCLEMERCRQCDECVLSQTTLFCDEVDCDCENPPPIPKKEYRRNRMKKLYAIFK